jgi:U3 small nucleolar RNA-associated protein 20
VFEFTPFMPAIFESFLSPRLEQFAAENTQAPTALMDLFWCWTKTRDYVRYLVDYDERVLPKCFACMSAPSVKPAVVARVLDMIENIFAMHDGENDMVDDKPFGHRLLLPYISALLDSLESVLANTSSLTGDKSSILAKDLLARRQIAILSQIAAHTSNPEQMQRLLDQMLPFLKKPNKIVPEGTKCDILKLIANGVGMLPDFQAGSSLNVQSSSYFAVVSQLFSTLTTRPSRQVLCEAFAAFAPIDSSLTRIAGLLDDLNSFSVSRVDSIDWDRRMTAFNHITDDLYRELRSDEWLPLLHNCLFSAQDTVRVVY